MPDTTLIRAGRLVDVLEGNVKRAQVISVRDQRIESIEPDGGMQGTRVVDLSQFTVLPGLIDCHAHLIGELETGHGYAALLQRSGAQEALSGVRNARDTLMAGFTSVRDIGTFRAFVDVALRDAIDRGDVLGPRMMCAGAYVTCSGGSGDFIKVIATGAVLTEGTVPGAPEFSEEELRAAVEEAALYDTHVAAHAHGAEGIKRAVRAGARSIEHGSLMDDEAISLMEGAGAYLVADVWNGDWIAQQGHANGWSSEVLRKNDETTEAQRQGFAKCVDAGVKIAFGTDSGVYPHAMAAKQFAYMVKFGMTPMQAVQSATVVAADLMGWRDRVGSIEPGLFADVMAVAGDPLEDVDVLTDVRFVMKGGEIVKG